METIKKELSNFLKENIFEKELEFNAESCFKELGIDSLAVLELVVFIEERFKFKCNFEVLNSENLKNIESLARYIKLNAEL